MAPEFVQAAIGFAVLLGLIALRCPVGLAMLAMLTPFWFALYGDRRQLWLGVAGVGITLAGPVVWDGAPRHELVFGIALERLRRPRGIRRHPAGHRVSVRFPTVGHRIARLPAT